jgi:two-component system copper resistance phosphate regulon response regulator CusR
MKVLIVEDDFALRDVLVRALTESGHVVDAAADGVTGEAMCTDESYDAIVLDIMLPGRDGLAIVETIRSLGVTTPVLFLTARTTEADTVAGLDAGADDYLRKPFGVAELLARLRSISRREKIIRETVLQAAGVRYDPVARRATRNDRELELTRREMAFLELFLRNAGRALTREAIASALWPADNEISSNVIDVYVKRLRHKLHGTGESRVLHTVRGIGYRFEDR